MRSIAQPRAMNLPTFISRPVLAAVGGMPRTYWWLWGGTLVNKVGSFVIAFLAIYLTQERNFSVEQAGGIAALYGAGSIFASPLGGVLTDRIGRKFTMVFGLTGGAAMMVCLGLARDPYAIAAATMGLGLVNDVYRPAVSAMIADVVPPADRLRAYGLMYWAINLGFSVAAVAAGMLIKHGYLTLFLVDAGSSLLFAALILCGVPETRPPEATPAAGSSAEGSLLTPLRDRVFLAFVLLNFGVALIFHQFLAALPMEMGNRGISPGEYGRVIALNGVMIVLFQPFTTRWLAARDAASVLAVGSMLTGLGFGFNAVASMVPLYAVSVAIWTVGEIIMTPVNSAVVAELSPVSMRGRYQGVFALSFSASMLAAPAIGSFVLGAWGRHALWGGCAVLGALCAVGHLSISARRRARIAELRVARSTP